MKRLTLTLQNHKMAQVGKDLKVHLVWDPLRGFLIKRKVKFGTPLLLLQQHQDWKRACPDKLNSVQHQF